MGILIKNPETERKARELAALTGETLTGAIDAALEARLADERGKRKRPTVEEMMAATRRLQQALGIVPGKTKPFTKEDFDELWDYTDEPDFKG